ncbi:hypothetical protein KAI68_00995 [bacterium]|nr:hypothetical protein [bacterium]
MPWQKNTITQNNTIKKEIEKLIKEKLPIPLGLNKQNEIIRLIFEILKKNNLTIPQFLNISAIKSYLFKQKAGFTTFKKILLQLRYPKTIKNEPIKNYEIFLPPLKPQKTDKKYVYSGKFRPKSIYIEKECLNYPLTQEILKKFPQIKPEIITKVKDFQHQNKKSSTSLKKDELFLIKENYDILKPCPCTKKVVSCGYYIFNLGFGCPYDCTYCYLQHYTNFPGILIPVNIEGILGNLQLLLNHTKIAQKRIGTGEFTDSLALDDITGYSKLLIPFFNQTEYILEFKTKSTNIANILNFKPTPHIVISWSINPQKIIDSEEHFTPSLEERLKSAKKLTEAGFRVGFHFDPVIYYETWEKDYQDVIEKMYRYAEKNIAWISIGSLRFHRTLKPVIENRFINSKILNGELLIHPGDKKMRYPDFMRKEIYSKMLHWIRKYDKNTAVYLCMEYLYIWKDIHLKLPYFS